MSEGALAGSLASKRSTYSQVMADRRNALTSAIQQTLPQHGRLVFEIGCGHGHFLTAFARAHPEMLCTGVDNDSDRVRRAERKMVRARLTNLHFLRSDAELFVEVLPPALRLAAVYILFPDPWPKLRHHKHRVVQPKFLSKLAEHMDADGVLFFRTDFAPYFEDTKKKLSVANWRISESEVWPFEHVSVFQSRAKSYQSLVARPPHTS